MWHAIVFGLVAIAASLTLGFGLELIAAQLPRTEWLPRISVLFGIVTGLYALSEATGISLPVPSPPWRVPRSLGAIGPSWFAAVFGAALGFGGTTAVTYFGYYALLAGVVLEANPIPLISLAAFGAVRSIVVVVITLAAARRGVRRASPMIASAVTALNRFDSGMWSCRAAALMAVGFSFFGAV